MNLNTKVTPPLLTLTAVSNYNNTDVIKHYGGMCLEKAINSPDCSIGMHSKTLPTEVKQAITNLFVGTSMYFGKIMPQPQAAVIAEELLATYIYRQLKLEDILAICNELKEADIINLTPARVMRQIKDYTHRRMQAVINLRIAESQDHKGDLNLDARILKSIRHLDRSNEEIVKGRLYMKNKIY